MDLQQIKQRFGIIGNSFGLNRAIDVAVQVAPTDLSVLITGESGTGKESFPQIIHQNSARKHGPYVAVNCGAIPEGTIDSELFGHEKGAFTGALSDRKGYFEEANKGTIFLDEIGELPLATQVRLLRVLETGEFMKVGSSKVLKTDVRVVAATNVEMEKAIKEGKFREDLYYRLNSVPIKIPPLRDRAEDIYLLFRKFSSDFANRYRMPAIKLTDDAKKLLLGYRWPGNIRQLKNITEQISVIEQEREIDGESMTRYLPYHSGDNLPALIDQKNMPGGADFNTEREILYKVLFDMKRDMNDLKTLVHGLLEDGPVVAQAEHANIVQKLYQTEEGSFVPDNIPNNVPTYNNQQNEQHSGIEDTEEFVEESLSLAEKEIELIKKALDKYNGKRKQAARELGISERTLYRKIKEYKIEG
ncbi:sigma-54 interaction domain-containing protein [Carboxylicivirga linearis]|uniref:Sigma-54-dependent Fis family transcriptional regulator n=1 Tax=Carboxylicivirga linearis TaxID=1628157 RepID=A0ABS5JSG1_9BACT|nr:sigma-54 dependent transcriptional regulator [Carboxylicivirga linearis]MBS2097787.1 sigma-54-dependent Fis family transcriptional regulator [Carboxylicivirga linearis]